VSNFPLRAGPASALVAVREFFRGVGFEDANLCARFKIEDMSSIGEARWDDAARESFEPALRACIDLFVRGNAVPEPALQAAFGDSMCDAFRTLGLVRPSKSVPGSAICPVWVYPVGAFVMASDRRDKPDDPDLAPGNDVVFPAIYALTSRFLEMLPDAAGRDVLDLCGGTGIAAMIMAATARSSATADLAERAVRFAEFNAALNSVHVESLCGDLYEPANGRTFDLITAHPPFVPELGERVIFRDAGAGGDEIIRRIVEGLPDHLRAGGSCVIVCWARDTDDGPFEARMRSWLGPRGDDFDIVFGLERSGSVEEIVDGMRHKRQNSPEEIQALYDRLKAMQTVRFVYGPILLQRRSSPGGGDPVTCRVKIARAARVPDLLRAIAWVRERGRSDFKTRVARSRPRLAACLELVARYGVVDGELAPADFTFSTEAPYRSVIRVEGWMVPLIGQCSGDRTVAEVHAAVASTGNLPGDFTLEAFIGLVGDSVGKGFLQVELPD
jgi:SAM-dependent methyltransferase